MLIFLQIFLRTFFFQMVYILWNLKGVEDESASQVSRAQVFSVVLSMLRALFAWGRLFLL